MNQPGVSDTLGASGISPSGMSPSPSPFLSAIKTSHFLSGDTYLSPSRTPRRTGGIREAVRRQLFFAENIIASENTVVDHETLLTLLGHSTPTYPLPHQQHIFHQLAPSPPMVPPHTLLEKSSYVFNGNKSRPRKQRNRACHTLGDLLIHSSSCWGGIASLRVAFTRFTRFQPIKASLHSTKAVLHSTKAV